MLTFDSVYWILLYTTNSKVYIVIPVDNEETQYGDYVRDISLPLFIDQTAPPFAVMYLIISTKIIRGALSVAHL